ncbi:MAG: hypothetical protein A4E49_00009 [Methanosaeta sp. PtaU1.Bin112]|nr:MAG: hypothetical protein A4E49_00009 [Methanosaeta sp. PtaU1.Bin112]
MDAKIFLVDDDGNRLRQMIETSFVTEENLQILLAHYPDLLPGDQINPENPRRWLLVTREVGIPGDSSETDRWSLDHLFLDQDGIPTFVECKRASNTQIRRQVVAQMLDYAANGTEYWNIDGLRQAAAETAGQCNKSLDDEVKRLLESEDVDVEGYWKKVEENLRSDMIRLIFVTDSSPKELRKLVDFLNRQMRDVEVIIVEIKQFLGEGQKAMVPRVIGSTFNKEHVATRRNFTEADFMEECEPELAEFFKNIICLANKKGYSIYWATTSFSIRKYLPFSDRYASVIYCYPKGRFDFYFAQLPISYEASETLRRELISTGIFRESGKKTLIATLNNETYDKAKEIVQFILERVDEIAESQKSSEKMQG